MKQYYYDYNGKRYESGAIIIIKESDICGHLEYKEAAFMYYDTESKRIVLRIGHLRAQFSEKRFFEICVKFTDNIDNFTKQEMCSQEEKKNKEATLKDELSIDSLLIAWIWYIIIMSVSILFNDCIVVWIFVSIIFFKYRKNKLRKAGFKK